jgi:predicted S18 family serine protease
MSGLALARDVADQILQFAVPEALDLARERLAMTEEDLRSRDVMYREARGSASLGGAVIGGLLARFGWLMHDDVDEDDSDGTRDVLAMLWVARLDPRLLIGETTVRYLSHLYSAPAERHFHLGRIDQLMQLLDTAADATQRDVLMEEEDPDL